jgi:hypothetical protein
MKKIFIFSYLLIAIASFAQVQYSSTYISTANSSTATLTSGSVFTGTAEDVSQYSEVRVSIKSDVASATDGFSAQFSPDGTNWDITDTYTIPANTGKTFGFGVADKFFRIVYTNGGTNQASFRLQTIVHKYRTKPSSNRPQDARTNDNDMEENLAYLMTYDPVQNVWNRQVTSMFLTGASAQTATVNNILPATSGATVTDVLNFNSGSVQVTSTGTAGTFIFEGSNDNTNFNAITVYNSTVLTGTPITAAITASASQITYIFPIEHRYIRLRIATTITGGSIQAFSTFRQAAFTAPVLQVGQATAANLNMTVGSGTVTTVSTVSTTNGGPTAESAASANNPLQVGGVVVPTSAATQNVTFVAADVGKLPLTTGAQAITKPYGTAETDWTYAAASGGISNTTTAVTIKTAAAASVRNYITGIQVEAGALGTATELAIRDGAAGTVIWRIFIPTSGLTATFDFPTPLKGTANTLLEVVTLTATVTGAVYVNSQGYTGF